jgi:hypothetical protein
VVHDVHGEPDESVPAEGRLGDEEVRQMAGAQQRVVEENGIARPERLDGMDGQGVLDGERHGPHVARRVRPLGDHAPVPIEDGHREVLALAGLLGVGRPVHRGADLHRDRVERSPDDPERDGIDPAHGPTVTIRLA